MNKLVGQYIDRYHILEQLGQGGMAVVFKAYDTRLERDVAIKFIRVGEIGPNYLTTMLKRFEREAKSLARMDHPNIVHVHDYGEYEGAPYLVMQYLPGGTMKHATEKPMPYVKAIRLLLPIARALEYAHKRGLVHRDVKPSNILITESGEPMLTDFGIAKILGETSGATLTGTGMGIGTPEYMAPEQWTGQALPESDIYALGVILYELVTGVRPYTADTPAAVFRMLMMEPLQRPKDLVLALPDDVERVLLKALAKEPADRYDSMTAFILALERCVSALPTDSLQLGMEPAVQALVEVAEDLERSGSHDAALVNYQKALALCPAGSEEAKNIETAIIHLSGPVESPAVEAPSPPVEEKEAISPASSEAVTRVSAQAEEESPLEPARVPHAPSTPKKEKSGWQRFWWAWVLATVVIIAGMTVVAVLVFGNLLNPSEAAQSVDEPAATPIAEKTEEKPLVEEVSPMEEPPEEEFPVEEPAGYEDEWGMIVFPPDTAVKIGLSAPMSGTYGSFGEGKLHAIDLAIGEYGGNLKGWQIIAMPLNDECSPEFGNQVAENFVTDPYVLGMIGPTCSGVAIPTLPIYGKAHMVTLHPSSTNIELTAQGYEHIFRLAANDYYQSEAAARFLFDTLEIRSLWILHDDTTYSKGFAQEVNEIFTSQLGGRVAAMEEMPYGDMDFSGFIARLMESGDKGVFYSGFDFEAAEFILQLREAGYDGLFLTIDAVMSDVFLGTGSFAAEGAYVTIGGLPNPMGYDAFVERYVTEFGVEPMQFDAGAYDATMILLRAAESIAFINDQGDLVVGKKALADTIRGMPYDGVSGHIEFGENGDVTSAVVHVFQVINGAFVEVDLFHFGD